MGISNDLMIDAALNAAGFVLAGFLAAVIYSMFNKRKQTTTTDSRGQYIAEKSTMTAPALSTSAGRIEFVDFKSGAERTLSPASRLQVSKEPANQFHKNRIEVIKQAREMLNPNRPMTQNSRPRPVVEHRTVKEAVNDQ